MPPTVKNPIRKAPPQEVTGGRGTVVARGRGTVTRGRGTVDRGRGTVGGSGKGGTSRIGPPGPASKQKVVIPEDVGGGPVSQRRSNLSASGGGDNPPNKTHSENSVGQGLQQRTGLIGGGVSEVAGTSGTRAREARSSEQTVSGSMSRTSYPPQNSLHRQPLPLVNQFPPLEVPDEEMRNGDEEEYYNDSLELEDEEEDEVDAPNPVDAPNADDEDFDQLLDNLLRLPGREQLMRLSPHPIPPLQSIW
ncbi:hypothetical protein AALP_AAs47366U000100 [Arabis alpina]|uniref:Uncharacterized protein n=1 Tax=Arabis alpina TaxID=50452 RepID=A0A087FYV8_ARAAL|nr:hypothetical protein AALP_AAs47366U000100 [Arabis alpina]